MFKTHLYKLTTVMVNNPATKPINTTTIEGIYFFTTLFLRKNKSEMLCLDIRAPLLFDSNILLNDIVKLYHVNICIL